MKNTPAASADIVVVGYGAAALAGAITGRHAALAKS
jgi:hypothetical protein